MLKVEYEPPTFHSVRERTNICSGSTGLITYFFYIIHFSKYCICNEINANKEVIELEHFLFLVFGFSEQIFFRKVCFKLWTTSYFLLVIMHGDSVYKFTCVIFLTWLIGGDCCSTGWVLFSTAYVDVSVVWWFYWKITCLTIMLQRKLS